MHVVTLAIETSDALLNEMADVLGMEVAELPYSFEDEPAHGILRRVDYLKVLSSGDDDECPLTRKAVEDAQMFEAEFLLVVGDG